MRVAVITTDNRDPFRQYESPQPWFGAAPEALLEGFAELPEIEIHVVTCIRKPVKSPEKLADNIWFHSLHVKKPGWMQTLFQGCTRAIRKRLQAIRPDMVHGQGTERECAMGAVLSSHPNVITIHGNMAELARLFKARVGSYGWLAGHLENFALRRTAGVFCNSAYTEGLVRPRARKTWRVPNPLREMFFAKPPAGPPGGRCVLLNVGVLSERKRQIELLEVARRLHEQGLDFQLQFVGDVSDAAYSARFLPRLKEAEALGYCRHLGLKSSAELIACFDAAHGLVHFPTEEAFGLVVAEAMARGLKFFGARLGGIKDISDGVPGAELFDAGDFDGLTLAIAGWIRSGHARQPDASALMRERYHPRVIARRHVEIYREVLANRRS
jgi:glycosyltransferase involved in cell wall biosynthesis